MMKVTLCLFAVLAVSFAQTTENINNCKNDGGDLCHKCEVMVNQCKTDFGSNINSVTKDQLTAEINKLCDDCFVGLQDSLCKSLLAGREDEILDDLRKGMSSYQACQTAGVC